MTRVWVGFALAIGLCVPSLVARQSDVRSESCRVLDGSYAVSLQRAPASSSVLVRVLKNSSTASASKGRNGSPVVPVNVNLFNADSASSADRPPLTPNSLDVVRGLGVGLVASFDASSIPDALDVVIVSSGGFPQKSCHFDARAVAWVLGKTAGKAPSATPAADVLIDERTDKLSRILIDSSRSGGPWWVPQQDDVQLSAPHLGKPLADYLRQQGMPVDEMRPGGIITPAALLGHAVVVRASAGSYTPEELSAYRDYVTGGGRLLLLSWSLPPGAEDNLAASFGIKMGGLLLPVPKIANPPPTATVSRFVAHPVTEGVGKYERFVGSAILEKPAAFTVLASAAPNTFLDLNYSRQRESDEPVGADVWGVIRVGQGTVLLCGDFQNLFRAPQPLTRNVFTFLMGAARR